MTRLTYRALPVAAVGVPASGLLIAARSNAAADIVLTAVGLIVLAESLAVLSNWRGGTDYLAERLRSDKSFFGYIPKLGVRAIAVPGCFIGVLLVVLGMTYLVTGG